MKNKNEPYISKETLIKMTEHFMKTSIPRIISEQKDKIQDNVEQTEERGISQDEQGN